MSLTGQLRQCIYNLPSNSPATLTHLHRGQGGRAPSYTSRRNRDFYAILDDAWSLVFTGTPSSRPHPRLFINRPCANRRPDYPRQKSPKAKAPKGRHRVGSGSTLLTAQSEGRENDLIRKTPTSGPSSTSTSPRRSPSGEPDRSQTATPLADPSATQSPTSSRPRQSRRRRQTLRHHHRLRLPLLPRSRPAVGPTSNRPATRSHRLRRHRLDHREGRAPTTDPTAEYTLWIFPNHAFRADTRQSALNLGAHRALVRRAASRFRHTRPEHHAVRSSSLDPDEPLAEAPPSQLSASRPPNPCHHSSNPKPPSSPRHSPRSLPRSHSLIAETKLSPANRIPRNRDTDHERQAPPTLFEKVWQQHLVAEPATSHRSSTSTSISSTRSPVPQAFEGSAPGQSQAFADPTAHIATVDHNVPTTRASQDRLHIARPDRRRARSNALRRNCADFGVELFDVQSASSRASSTSSVPSSASPNPA